MLLHASLSLTADASALLDLNFGAPAAPTGESRPQTSTTHNILDDQLAALGKAHFIVLQAKNHLI